jgi:hypothetical protein
MGWGKKRGIVTVTVCACVLYGSWPLWESIAPRPLVLVYINGVHDQLFKR